MDRNSDLDASLKFVIGRVEEQVTRSGEPLTNEQRLLLRYLPTWGAVASHGEDTVLVPRNLDLEKICALGKQAYSNDRNVSPPSLDWEFALVVFKLNRHPMAGFLQEAGVKYRRPWDVILLVVAALLVIAGGMALIFLLGNFPWSSYQWAACSVGFVVLLSLVYLASRRIENRRLRLDLERFRRSCRFVSTVAG